MSTLTRFLEALDAVWRVVVVLVACVAGFSFYQYRNNQLSLLNGDAVGTVVESARKNTNFGFLGTAFDRIERFFGFGEANPTGSAATAIVPIPGPDTTANQHAAGSPLATGSRQTATVPANGPRSESLALSRPDTSSMSSGPTLVARSENGVAVDVNNPRARVALRRLASQFCRATRAIALYYTDHISGPNGFAGIRVGSGARYPSIERLTNAPERSLAEKELEVRLRCDYELAYGAGERADPKRPAFEQWRQATLERHYGEVWTRIDLTHIPLPDDARSRGEWYVLAQTSQE